MVKGAGMNMVGESKLVVSMILFSFYDKEDTFLYEIITLSSTLTNFRRSVCLVNNNMLHVAILGTI